MITVAVVPVKDPAHAKSRLAQALSAGERDGLVRAMLADVLAALARASQVASVFVVADDPAVAPPGTAVIREPGNRGYDAAVATAAADPRAASADALLVVPGDVPLVTAAVIDALAAPLRGPAVRLAPARDGDGTNGLLIRPPGLMATRFGPGSFARHQDAARAAGAVVTVLRAAGLALDIDTPQDLGALCAAGSDTETSRFLDRSGIRARMRGNAESGTGERRGG